MFCRALQPCYTFKQYVGESDPHKEFSPCKTTLVALGIISAAAALYLSYGVGTSASLYGAAGFGVVATLGLGAHLVVSCSPLQSSRRPIPDWLGSNYTLISEAFPNLGAPHKDALFERARACLQNVVVTNAQITVLIQLLALVDLKCAAKGTNKESDLYTALIEKAAETDPETAIGLYEAQPEEKRKIAVLERVIVGFAAQGAYNQARVLIEGHQFQASYRYLYLAIAAQAAKQGNSEAAKACIEEWEGLKTSPKRFPAHNDDYGSGDYGRKSDYFFLRHTPYLRELILYAPDKAAQVLNRLQQDIEEAHLDSPERLFRDLAEAFAEKNAAEALEFCAKLALPVRLKGVFLGKIASAMAKKQPHQVAKVVDAIELLSCRIDATIHAAKSLAEQGHIELAQQLLGRIPEENQDDDCYFYVSESGLPEIPSNRIVWRKGTMDRPFALGNALNGNVEEALASSSLVLSEIAGIFVSRGDVEHAKQAWEKAGKYQDGPRFVRHLVGERLEEAWEVVSDIHQRAGNFQEKLFSKFAEVYPEKVLKHLPKLLTSDASIHDFIRFTLPVLAKRDLSIALEAVAPLKGVDRALGFVAIAIHCEESQLQTRADTLPPL